MAQALPTSCHVGTRPDSRSSFGTASPVPSQLSAVPPSTAGTAAAAHVRQVNIGGTQKQVVSNQFNSPLGMYSDDTIAEAAITNQYVDQYK